jgi:hypothetical protein
MNRIAKLLGFISLLAITFALALAETPRAEATPEVCSLQEIRQCDQYCGSRGCIGTCITRCLCNC